MSRIAIYCRRWRKDRAWEQRQGLRIPKGISEYDRSYFRALLVCREMGGPAGYVSSCSAAERTLDLRAWRPTPGSDLPLWAAMTGNPFIYTGAKR